MPATAEPIAKDFELEALESRKASIEDILAKLKANGADSYLIANRQVTLETLNKRIATLRN